jgi:hypothetical protein
MTPKERSCWGLFIFYAWDKLDLDLLLLLGGFAPPASSPPASPDSGRMHRTA